MECFLSTNCCSISLQMKIAGLIDLHNLMYLINITVMLYYHNVFCLITFDIISSEKLLFQLNYSLICSGPTGRVQHSRVQSTMLYHAQSSYKTPLSLVGFTFFSEGFRFYEGQHSLTSYQTNSKLDVRTFSAAGTFMKQQLEVQSILGPSSQITVFYQLTNCFNMNSHSLLVKYNIHMTFNWWRYENRNSLKW